MPLALILFLAHIAIIILVNIPGMSYKKIISKMTERSSSDSAPPAYNSNDDNQLNAPDLHLRTLTGSPLLPAENKEYGSYEERSQAKDATT